MGRKRLVTPTVGEAVEVPLASHSSVATTEPIVSAIDNLNHLEPEDDTCAICLEIPKIKGLIGGCSHVFCFACIKSWSDIENTCPICKKPFNQISSQSVPSTTETSGINDSNGNKRKRKAKDKAGGEVVHVQNKTQKQNNHNNNMFAMRHFFGNPFMFGNDSENESDDDIMFGGNGGNFPNHVIEMLMVAAMMGGIPFGPGRAGPIGGRGNRNGGRNSNRAGRGQQRRNMAQRNDPITIDDNVPNNSSARRSTPEVIDLISDDDDEAPPQLIRIGGNSSSSSSSNNQSNNRNAASSSSSSSSSSHTRSNQRRP
jgi:hypothetical protein